MQNSLRALQNVTSGTLAHTLHPQKEIKLYWAEDNQMLQNYFKIFEKVSQILIRFMNSLDQVV